MDSNSEYNWYRRRALNGNNMFPNKLLVTEALESGFVLAADTFTPTVHRVHLPPPSILRRPTNQQPSTQPQSRADVRSPRVGLLRQVQMGEAPGLKHHLLLAVPQSLRPPPLRPRH